MGNCSSGGNKDHEVDLFLNKHHKANPIHTDKNNYEVSSQHWDPKMKTLEAKVLDNDPLVDEIE